MLNSFKLKKFHSLGNRFFLDCMQTMNTSARRLACTCLRDKLTAAQVSYIPVPAPGGFPFTVTTDKFYIRISHLYCQIPFEYIFKKKYNRVIRAQAQEYLPSWNFPLDIPFNIQTVRHTVKWVSRKNTNTAIVLPLLLITARHNGLGDEDQGQSSGSWQGIWIWRTWRTVNLGF